MDVDSAFARGLSLGRAHRYFAAHEAFEEAWRAAPAAERDFFQGLVHVVVAWYQDGRGNLVGCSRQLEKAERRLRPYAPVYRGIDVARLLDQLEHAQPPELAPLDLAEAHGVEHPTEADVQPPLTVEEQEQPEHDQHRAARGANVRPPLAQRPERAHEDERSE